MEQAASASAEQSAKTLAELRAEARRAKVLARSKERMKIVMGELPPNPVLGEDVRDPDTDINALAAAVAAAAAASAATMDTQEKHEHQQSETAPVASSTPSELASPASSTGSSEPSSPTSSAGAHLETSIDSTVASTESGTAAVSFTIPPSPFAHLPPETRFRAFVLFALGFLLGTGLLDFFSKALALVSPFSAPAVLLWFCTVELAFLGAAYSRRRDDADQQPRTDSSTADARFFASFLGVDAHQTQQVLSQVERALALLSAATSAAKGLFAAFNDFAFFLFALVTTTALRQLLLGF